MVLTESGPAAGGVSTSCSFHPVTHEIVLNRIVETWLPAQSKSASRSTIAIDLGEKVLLPESGLRSVTRAPAVSTAIG